MVKELWQWPLQAVAYALFCLPIYYFSSMPPYIYLDAGQAELKLAFNHAGELQVECLQRSREELLKLAPNMRRPNVCARERSPLRLDLSIDGKLLAKKVFRSPGLHEDGTVFVYAKFPIPSGEHTLSVHMNDNVRVEGYTAQGEQKMKVAAGAEILVGFDHVSGKFTFQ